MPSTSSRRSFMASAGVAVGTFVARSAAAQPAPATDKPAEQPAAARLVLALQSFLDPNTEALVRKTWRALTDAGIPASYYLQGARPHITTGSWRVAAFDEDWMRRLATFCQACPRVPIRLVPRWSGQRGIDLIPDETPALLDYHKRVHEAFPNVGEFYRDQDRPGQWHPHLTTASWREEQAAQAREICRPLAEPFDAEIEYLGWVTFGQSNRFLANFPLTGRPT